MSDSVIIANPSRAAEIVCHEEQMVIWTADMAGALSLERFLRDDLSYDQVLELHAVIGRELRSIIEMAFDHPEARTIIRQIQR